MKKVTVIVEEYGFVLVRTTKLTNAPYPEAIRAAVEQAGSEALAELARAGAWTIKQSAEKQFTPGGDTYEPPTDDSDSPPRP